MRLDGPGNRTPAGRWGGGIWGSQTQFLTAWLPRLPKDCLLLVWSGFSGWGNNQVTDTQVHLQSKSELQGQDGGHRLPGHVGPHSAVHSACAPGSGHGSPHGLGEGIHSCPWWDRAPGPESW